MHSFWTVPELVESLFDAIELEWCEPWHAGFWGELAQTAKLFRGPATARLYKRIGYKGLYALLVPSPATATTKVLCLTWKLRLCILRVPSLTLWK